MEGQVLVVQGTEEAGAADIGGAAVAGRVDGVREGGGGVCVFVEQ